MAWPITEYKCEDIELLKKFRLRWRTHTLDSTKNNCIERTADGEELRNNLYFLRRGQHCNNYSLCYQGQAANAVAAFPPLALNLGIIRTTMRYFSSFHAGFSILSCNYQYFDSIISPPKHANCRWLAIGVYKLANINGISTQKVIFFFPKCQFITIPSILSKNKHA